MIPPQIPPLPPKELRDALTLLLDRSYPQSPEPWIRAQHDEQKAMLEREMQVAAKLGWTVEFSGSEMPDHIYVTLVATIKGRLVTAEDAKAFRYLPYTHRIGSEHHWASEFHNSVVSFVAKRKLLASVCMKMQRLCEGVK